MAVVIEMQQTSDVARSSAGVRPPRHLQQQSGHSERAKEAVSQLREQQTV